MSSCSWELGISGYTLLNSLISLANSSLVLANGFFVLGLIALVDNLPRTGSMELCPDAGTRMAGALFRSLLATRLDIRAFCPTWCASNPVPLLTFTRSSYRRTWKGTPIPANPQGSIHAFTSWTYAYRFVSPASRRIGSCLMYAPVSGE